MSLHFARDARGRASASLLDRLHPATLRRALARRLALRQARKLARAGCDAATIARRTGLAHDLVALAVRTHAR